MKIPNDRWKRQMINKIDKIDMKTSRLQKKMKDTSRINLKELHNSLNIS